MKAKKELDYVDRKVLHMLRMFGAGQAGYNARTRAAISADRARLIGVDMVQSKWLDNMVRRNEA